MTTTKIRAATYARYSSKMQREASIALRPYAKANGEVVFDAPAHIAVAERPA